MNKKRKNKPIVIVLRITTIFAIAAVIFFAVTSLVGGVSLLDLFTNPANRTIWNGIAMAVAANIILLFLLKDKK